jgi:cell division septum initiation protein DivIVA
VAVKPVVVPAASSAAPAAVPPASPAVVPLSPEQLERQNEQRYRETVIAVAKGEDVPLAQIQMACFNACKTPATFNVDLKRLQERIEAAKKLEEGQRAQAAIAQASKELEDAQQACNAARAEAERAFHETMLKAGIPYRQAKERLEQLQATAREGSSASPFLHHTGDPAIDEQARQACGVAKMILERGGNRSLFVDEIENAKQVISRMTERLAGKYSRNEFPGMNPEQIQQHCETELQKAKDRLAYNEQALKEAENANTLHNQQLDKVQKILNQKCDPFRMRWSE